MPRWFKRRESISRAVQWQTSVVAGYKVSSDFHVTVVGRTARRALAEYQNNDHAVEDPNCKSRDRDRYNGMSHETRLPYTT